MLSFKPIVLAAVLAAADATQLRRKLSYELIVSACRRAEVMGGDGLSQRDSRVEVLWLVVSTCTQELTSFLLVYVQTDFEPLTDVTDHVSNLSA